MAIQRHEKALADPDLYSRDQRQFERLTAEVAGLRQELAAAEERWLDVAAKAEALG